MREGRFFFSIKHLEKKVEMLLDVILSKRLLYSQLNFFLYIMRLFFPRRCISTFLSKFRLFSQSALIKNKNKNKKNLLSFSFPPPS